MKGSTKNQNSENQVYDVKVTRAKEVKEGQVVFDMVVNGVTIYGCWYREGVSKKGEEYQLISFPSHPDDKGEKYYNHVWFKIEDELKSDIVDQLQKLV